ncbi:MAG: AGE family epimerase/isomerase [Phycisphaerales bacterium]|nr:AGE family epimerase/isomerase [Phycisphaerales bacterium]
MNADRINTLKEFYQSALYGNVMPFWQEHGVDREHGGFFTCLARDGRVYSSDKSVWFAGRAAWTYAALYELSEARTEWLELARHGLRFLSDHCFAPSGKMFFSVDRIGRPLQMRRYVYSEVFATLAFAKVAQVTNDPNLRDKATHTYRAFKKAIETPGALPPKISSETRPMRALSPLMCHIHVAEVLFALTGDRQYDATITALIEELLRDFVDLDRGIVLETISGDGSRLDTPEGRVMNPGHAIETAWFVMEVARRRNDRKLIDTMAKALVISLERGWDAEFGGLLYFIDVEDKPSPYLEHEMKLWWPHCEGLYATLLAHHLTGRDEFADWFERIHAWTFGHFPDPEFGEWFGYLRRDGTPSSTLKGNMWKGPFHIPRALLLCHTLLTEMKNSAPT